jgi:hypothetical protein
MDSITLIGLIILVFSCLTKIFEFYGVDKSTYSVYMFFYIFISLCILVLPKEEDTF